MYLSLRLSNYSHVEALIVRLISILFDYERIKYPVTQWKRCVFEPEIEIENGERSSGFRRSATFRDNLSDLTPMCLQLSERYSCHNLWNSMFTTEETESWETKWQCNFRDIWKLQICTFTKNDHNNIISQQNESFLKNCFDLINFISSKKWSWCIGKAFLLHRFSVSVQQKFDIMLTFHNYWFAPNFFFTSWCNISPTSTVMR